MAADGATREPESEDMMPTSGISKRQGSKILAERLQKYRKVVGSSISANTKQERRISTSTQGDTSARTKSWQSSDDPKSLESRLAAIRQTHNAVLQGIEVAQDNMIKMMQGDTKLPVGC
ncbi:hypothetical protein, conserved [Eimeria tenella]|uniref:Uncharacterized protein n=1 Tax=Eimeria tenella TaxID=5802 RepID=U6KQ23_EIMTE|nr:hypothetical protein, conserved [Eimeria tenella]CDJ39008.1 hypothetical protein, conserved [Eimeria tenella]|eukprot:XP_013229763.1 hypothetical protein, conserved [Eimeria tenella]